MGEESLLHVCTIVVYGSSTGSEGVENTRNSVNEGCEEVTGLEGSAPLGIAGVLMAQHSPAVAISTHDIQTSPVLLYSILLLLHACWKFWDTQQESTSK